MKYLVLVVCLFLLIPFAIAEDEIDYSNPNDVNGLSSTDLSTAISNGDITDLTIIEDSKLAQALQSDPSLMSGNTQMMAEVDSRAERDISFLNNNPEMKKQWFTQRGITDQGAELYSFVNGKATTANIPQTTFAVANFPGATLTSQGKLIFPTGEGQATFSGGIITVSSTESQFSNTYIVDQGVVILDDTAVGSFKISKGTLTTQTRSFASAGEFEVIQSDMLGTFIQGNEIHEYTFDSQAGAIGIISGSAFVKESEGDADLVLQPDTTYTSFKEFVAGGDGIQADDFSYNSIEITADVEQPITFSRIGCQDQTNCIYQRDNGGLEISSDETPHILVKHHAGESISVTSTGITDNTRDLGYLIPYDTTFSSFSDSNSLPEDMNLVIVDGMTFFSTPDKFEDSLIVPYYSNQPSLDEKVNFMHDTQDSSLYNIVMQSIAQRSSTEEFSQSYSDVRKNAFDLWDDNANGIVLQLASISESQENSPTNTIYGLQISFAR